MRAVWKVPLNLYEAADSKGQRAWLPSGAKLLCVQDQYDKPTAWFEVDPTVAQSGIVFRLFGTGHTIDDDHLMYLGTTQHDGGALVLHLYSKPEDES